MKHRILSLVVASLFTQPRYGLALEVESLDKIPEPQRALYVEKDGKFRLDVDGVEDVTGLKNSLAAAREDAKKERQEKAVALQKLEALKDIDPEEYRRLKKSIENDEDSKLLKEGGLEKLLEKKTERILADHKRQLQERDTREEGYKTRLTKLERRALSDALRGAASKAGMVQSAVDDAVLHAEKVFTIDEEGNPLMLGDDKKPVLGKGGKPVSVEDWIEEQKEKKPHWFPAGSSGSGAGGSGGAGGAKTIKRAAFDALGERERAQKMRDGFKVVD